MGAESMLFYRSYMEALQEVGDPEVFRQIVTALFYYACDGREPDPSQLQTAEARIIWKLVRPLIDANVSRRENGRLGGRPRKQQPEPQDKAGAALTDEVKTIGFDLSKPMVSEAKTFGYETQKPNKEGDKDIKEDKDIYGEYKGGIYRDTPRACAKEDPPDPPTPRGPHQRVIMTDRQVRDLRARYGEAVVTEYIRRLDTHLSTGGHKTNHALVIDDWITRDRQAREPCRQQKKGGFHNFRERDYDYDLLAEQLRNT